MISDLTLRLARETDALRIAQMSRDQIERGLGWSWTTQRVLRSIFDAETNVVVAFAAGKLCGFAIMKYTTTKPTCCCWRCSRVRGGRASAPRSSPGWSRPR